MSIPKRKRERDHLVIMAQILFTALTPTLKTHIMYGVRMSYAQLQEYLKLMLDLKVLEEIRDGNTEKKAYRTTKKGMGMLKAINEIRWYLGKESIGVSHGEKP